MKLLTAFAICTCAWAQSGINRPQIGKMLDASGAVRTVYGITASVMLGAAEITGVLSSACAKTFCLAKTETSIVSPTGTAATLAGPAMFAFNGNTAFVWFPQSRQLAQWQNDALTPMDVSVDGEVLSIRARGGAVDFAVRRRSGVWIVSSNGGVVDSLPQAEGPVMLIPGGVVYATRAAIAIRDVIIPLDGVQGFSRMSDGYVQVRAGGIDYSLRIEKGHETLFQLPGVQQ